MLISVTFSCLTCVILILCAFAVVFVIRSQIFVESNVIVTTFNLYAVGLLFLLFCSLLAFFVYRYIFIVRKLTLLMGLRKRVVDLCVF